MPRKRNAGSFQGHPHYRWVRMINDVRYTLKCKAKEPKDRAKNTFYLGLPREKWTESASLPYANKWWEEHQSASPQLQQLIASDAELAGIFEANPQFIQMMDADSFLLNGIQNFVKTRKILEKAGMPVELARTSNADQPLFEAVFDHIDQFADPEMHIPPDTTVKGVVDRFLKLRFAEMQSGKRSKAGYDNIRRWLGEFITHLGPTSDFSSVNDVVWERFYLHIQAKMSDSKKPWSDSYARDVLTHARTLIIWAGKQKLCTRPETLDDFRISVADPEVVETFSIDEVKKCLAAATGQTRLHLLLMINLGHTQRDISDLEKYQVNLDEGTIRRKRSKTRGKKTVPIVVYKLWGETLKELKIHMANCEHPKLALCNRKGLQWVREELKGDEQKYCKTDGIDSNFAHIQRKTGIKKGLSVFRATSSDLIARSEHRNLRSLFLGHSNKILADRRYANAPNSPLTKAITWLGTKYGIK